MGIVRAYFVFALLGAASCTLPSPSPAEESATSEDGLAGIQIGGGLIGALCTETTGNPLGKIVVDLAAGSALPDSDVAGPLLCKQAGEHPTNECRDYCETRAPAGLDGIAANALRYSAFSSWIPAEYWTSISGYLLGQESAIPKEKVGLLQCATLVGWAAAENYLAAKACERGSQCVTCDDTSTNTRNACLIGQTALFCAEALGFEPGKELQLLSAACSIGRLCNKGIVLESCRRSCEQSMPLAAPIAQPVETPQGQERTCCMCDRSRWEDRPLIWGGDQQLGSDWYYSPVSDYAGPVPECEGRNGSSTEIAGQRGPEGYPTYYFHENCHKARFAGAVCPADSGYHAPL